MKQIAIRPLSPRETALLNECEETIAAGLTTFIEVGGALLTIHEGKLYRREFATFDEYCTAKWQIGRAYAYRLMDAVRALLTIGDTDLPLPTNEAQARALANVPEDRRVAVWDETLKRTDNKPTAAAITAVAEETAAADRDGTAAAQAPSEVQRPGDPAGTGEPTENAGVGTCDPTPAPDPGVAAPVEEADASSEPEAAMPPAVEGEHDGPAPSPAGPSCEKCGTGIDDDGYRRCPDCDPDGMHTAAEDGTCRLCKLLGTVPDEYLPIEVGEGVHGLQLQCRCGAVVSHLKAGMPLGIALVEAHVHAENCQGSTS